MYCPKKAVYPGTFDPITYGHLDLIKRALKLFDHIIIAIGENPTKRPLFSLEERKQMIEESLAEFREEERQRLTVKSFTGLLVDFAAREGACAVLRGLRAVSDFEYEFQLALMNRRLNRRIDTVFLMPGFRWIYISSTIIKEAAQFGGDVSGLVPPVVLEKLKEKYHGC